jgi:hypothetical protein
MSRAAVFPEVEGANLDRRPFVLPRDIERELAIVLVAFQREQQAAVDTWLPVARAIEDRKPRVCVYELPVIRRMNRLSRSLLDGAMRRGIPDQHARQHTITLYLDKPAFRNALGIESEDRIEVMLVDRDGRVLWRRTGPCDREGQAALERAIADHVSDR